MTSMGKHWNSASSGKEEKTRDMRSITIVFKTICDIISSYHIKLNPTLIENKTNFTDLTF